jgi:hypothetical protein
MNYTNEYQKLISKAKSRLSQDGYFEKHHIFPKSLGGKDMAENLVFLSAREHFIAHLLLAKIYGGPMIYAAYAMMYQNDKKYTSRKYSWLKIAFSELHSKRVISDETRKKMSDAQKNSIRSKLAREKACEANRNRTVSDATKEKISRSITGRNLNTEHKKKISEALKKKPRSKEHQNALNKSRKPWTAEMKQKLSDARKGKTLTDEHKKKISISLKKKNCTQII